MTKRELQQNEGRKFMYSKSKWRNKEWKNIVDDVLRTGGNRKNSVKRIIYEFMQDQKVHVEYIQDEFGIGGKGLFLTARNTLSGLKMGSRFQREKQHKIILWILY